MNISNILKYISLSLLSALLMIFWQKIISFVIASNLELSKCRELNNSLKRYIM